MKVRKGLQKEEYAGLEATFELSAQPAVRAVKKVVDTCTTEGSAHRGVRSPRPLNDH
ncbi:hypothetical protein ACWDAZ_36040 [Streptomyces sp. NPDC001215]